MTQVTIIGPGNIGAAVAGLAKKAGASVQLLGRNPESTGTVAAEVGATAGAVGDAITGDIVVLAVPHAALSEIAATYGEQLKGRVVVDTTNPVNLETFDSLMVAADSSATAELAAALPDARVVKGFNVNFAATLASGEVAGEPTTVLVAGDDEAARESVIELVSAAGLRGVALGGLNRARELESIGFAQMVLAAQEKLPWTGALTLRG